MDKEEVIKNLRILGIVDVEQFQKGDLRYWWQIKFKEIKKYYGKESRDLLIKTNTAFGELEKLDMKLVRRCLSEKNAIPSPKPHASENINYYQRQKINRSRIALEKLKENLSIVGKVSSGMWGVSIVINYIDYLNCYNYYYYCNPYWEDLFKTLTLCTVIIFFVVLLYDLFSDE